MIFAPRALGFCLFGQEDSLRSISERRIGSCRQQPCPIALGSYVIRRNPKGISVLCNCIPDAAFCKEHGSQICVSIRVFWAQLEDFLIMNDRVICLTLSQQGTRKVVLSLRLIW